MARVGPARGGSAGKKCPPLAGRGAGWRLRVSHSKDSEVLGRAPQGAVQSLRAGKGEGGLSAWPPCSRQDGGRRAEAWASCLALSLGAWTQVEHKDRKPSSHYASFLLFTQGYVLMDFFS